MEMLTANLLITFFQRKFQFKPFIMLQSTCLPILNELILFYEHRCLYYTYYSSLENNSIDKASSVLKVVPNVFYLHLMDSRFMRIKSQRILNIMFLFFIGSRQSPNYELGLPFENKWPKFYIFHVLIRM